MTLHRAFCFVLILAAAACSRKEPAPPASPPVAPAPAHTPATAADTRAGQVVVGPVLETMNAASYTYVRVKGDGGDVWAAAPEFSVKVGDRVRVPLEMPMTNFHSANLNRDFPLLYFVAKITPADGASEAVGAAPAASPGSAGPHGMAGSTTATVTTPMPAPPGGMTIASLWADRKALAGKPVTIHGVVVKYNPGILGVNWIHVQDGTGKPADGSNDVTVTTTDETPIKPGDTVLVSGTAVVEKNIGEGYKYPVLVEKARVTVQKTAGS